MSPRTGTASSSKARKVLYVQYTNPGAYPPLVHSAHLLAEAGCDVRMLGIGSTADPLTVPAHDRISVDLLPIAEPGWRQKAHYARFIVWAAARARRWAPDWIYASDPLSCPAALVLARVSGAKLLYHEHDWPEVEEAAAPAFMKTILTARRKAAVQADIRVAPNAERARALAIVAGDRDVVVAWNTPRRTEVVRWPSPTQPDRLRLWYHGSVNPANLPTVVIHAVTEVPASVSLQITGYETRGHRGYVSELRTLADHLGVADRVNISDPIPRSMLVASCAGADVGLALLPNTAASFNERTKVGASNKPFDYMAGGLALLVPDAPEWRATFVEPGFGLAVDQRSAASIAGAIRRLVADPLLRAEMGRRGQRKISTEWNYETAFAPVMARIMAGSATSVEELGAA
jgi:glycosyltransferase involved in cell wall biosynthesis